MGRRAAALAIGMRHQFMNRVWITIATMVIGLSQLGGCASWSPTVASDATVVDRDGDDPVASSDRLMAAEQARADGDYDVALALFREIIAEDPKETRAYLGIGDVYLERDEHYAAEPFYARAARLEPDNYKAQHSHGNILYLLNRFVEALQAYQRALTIDPDGIEANLGLGSTYLELDEPERAVAYAEQAVRIDPTNGRARANLGTAYHQTERIDEAVEQYLIALELTDDPAPVMMELVVVLIREERFREAANTAESLVRLAPSAEAYTQHGRALFKLGDYAGSLDAYRKAVALNPGHWTALNGVGVNALNAWLLSNKTDDDARLEARAAFRRSLRINNNQQRVIMLMQKYGLT
jgi:tetratricopeptide (TPR) repeat protein